MSDENGQLALIEGAAGAAEAPRGRGRPAGARNKRGRDWQALAATMQVHPIEFLLRTVAKSEAELATELQLYRRTKEGLAYADEHGRPQLDLLAAHQARRQAAVDVLPYVEQKLPALEDDDATAAKRILMIVGNLTPEQARTAEAVTGLHFGIKQNQRVIDADPAKSDGDQSDDDANALTIHEDR